MILAGFYPGDYIKMHEIIDVPVNVPLNVPIKSIKYKKSDHRPEEKRNSVLEETKK